MVVDLSPRRRRAVLGGLVGLLILAGATLPFLPHDNSIQDMLPGSSGIHRMLNFLHEARFASQVALSFERSDGVSQSDFTDAIDETVERLNSPHIERVIHKIDLPSAGEDILFFQQQLPSLMDEQQFATLTNRLTPAGVEMTLRRKMLDLMRPGGSIALPLIQRDPFGIEQDLFIRLQTLASSSGYTIEIQKGYLFSADGNHALVVLETSAPVTDSIASRELLDSVDADAICGHRHAVSNEAMLKRDVQRAVLAAAIGFILLFSLCFRDHRAQFIFAIPLASVLLSMHICRWITGPLSLFVMGFGVVIVGIAVDYGIHIYVALRAATDPAKAWRGVVRPIVLGALTTLGVFAAFFAAGVPGYTQMAVFSITSILLSLLGALFVLPLLLKSKAIAAPKSTGKTVRSPNFFFALWLLLLATLLIPFPRLSFDSDLRSLDGSEPAIWNAEERFRSVWGDGAEALALVVLDAPDAETALHKNDQLFAAVKKQGDAEEFSSFSKVWKSRATREKNLARWQGFWTPKKIQTLRTTFADQKLGFKPDAFDQFFQTLEKCPELADVPTENQMFENLQTRFIQSLGGTHQLVSFFPDTDEWMVRVKQALGDSEALLVSRREINRVLSTETVRTVKRLASLAVALVVLFTVLLMRRPSEVVLALLPAIVSVLAVLKTLQTVGLAVNIPTLISGIVVIGLAIDYGIFMVFGSKRGTLRDVCVAVTLSTITSLIGAGVLVLTQHPALFSIGVTLVAGLTAAYVTALCAIPFLARFFLKKDTSHE